MNKYKVIDLFAGAGGMSLGFQQTGKFDIVAAFENSPFMQDTYRLNHPGVEVLGDVCKADYDTIQGRFGKIDVVIGGPPCQGFSNANRQKNHVISQNNMLVKQYIRAVVELQPKAFVMENVSMLHSNVHRFFLDQADVGVIEKYGVPFKETSLYLLDKEYMFDGVLDLIRNYTLIEKYRWPENHYAVLNVIYKASKNVPKMKESLEKHRNKLQKYAQEYITWDCIDNISLSGKKAFEAVCKYYDGSVKIEDLRGEIIRAIMIQRMIKIANEIHTNNIVVDKYSIKDGLVAVIRSYSVHDYLKAIFESDDNGYITSSRVLCAADYGAPQKRLRFVIMGVKKDLSATVDLPKGTFSQDQYRTVRDAISDLELVNPVTKREDDKGIPLVYKGLGVLADSLRDSRLLRNHIITKTTNTAMERFRVLKQGQNFHSLDESLKTNTYTDTSRTQNTIYLRLNYDEPSGTVVNVRKSMWIHPTLDRAISVREAARLQTFPDSFVFCGTKDKQYQQVGNAVPPLMAKSIALKLAENLCATTASKDI